MTSGSNDWRNAPFPLFVRTVNLHVAVVAGNERNLCSRFAKWKRAGEIARFPRPSEPPTSRPANVVILPGGERKCAAAIHAANVTSTARLHSHHIRLNVARFKSKFFDMWRVNRVRPGAFREDIQGRIVASCLLE